MKRFNLLVVSVALLLMGCSESKTSSVNLSVSPTTLNYAMEGGPQTLEIRSDGDWSINDIPDWLTLSAVTGVGDKDVTVTARRNDTGVLRQYQIVVRTSDNGRIIPVTVSQSAGSTYDDYGLAVDDASEHFLSGASLSSDSVHVESNVQWVLEGPDWMRAAWNGVSVAIDGKSQCSGSGTLMIMGLDNKDADDRSGVLTLRSKVNNATVEIPVTQMGALNVRPVVKVVMANSFSFYWKYGMLVKSIYWQVYENEATAERKDDDWAISHYSHIETVSPNTVSTRKALKPNTTYEICGLGMSADYYTKYEASGLKVTTMSDQNAALAAISNVHHDDDGWKYQATMNPYAKGYYIFAYYDAARYASYGDSYLALIIYQAMRKNPDRYQLKTKNSSYVANTTDDLHIVTWAVDAAGNLSSVMSRETASGAGGNAAPRMLQAPTPDEVNAEMPTDSELREMLNLK